MGKGSHYWGIPENPTDLTKIDKKDSLTVAVTGIHKTLYAYLIIYIHVYVSRHLRLSMHLSKCVSM